MMTANDLVVVVPGITGSTLAKNGQLVWAPTAGALVSAIRTLGNSIAQLRLPDGIGDEHPGDGVEAVGIIRDLHSLPGVWSPFDGYTRLLRRLGQMKRDGRIGDVLPFPYDWRLSNRYNGRRLAQVIGEALSQWRDSDPARAEAQVVLVCHSMGGLVARWYVEECGGAEVSRKVITLGTPYRGSAKAIDQLVNGVRYGLGPLAFEFTEFARSMPSSYQLLPDYACVEAAGSLHRLDEIVLPSLNTTMLRDSIRFHRQLAANDGSAAANATHVIIGTQQPTWTTAHPTVNGAQLQDTIGDDNDFGDATVPLVGAIGFGLPMDTNRVSRFSETHGQLQSNQAVLDEIEAIISAKPVRRRDTGSVSIGLRAPEMVVVGDPVSISLDLHLNGNARTPSIAIEFERQETDGSFTSVTRRLPDVHNRPTEIALNVRDPGAYRLRVTGATTGAHVAPVTTNVLVWPNT